MEKFVRDVCAAYPAFGDALDTPHSAGSAYSTMERFARFLVDSYEAGERDTLRQAFDLVEHALVAGTTEVREGIAIGFFEALQNIASHRTFGPEAFERYLGDRSRQAWSEVNAIWQGKESLAEVVAVERGLSIRKRWWQYWRRREAPRELLAKVENPELRALIEGMTRENRKK